MKKNSLFVAMLALVLVFGTMIIGCDTETTEEETEKTPEEKTEQERWSKYVSSTATCTLEYSVAADGTNTITVGGTAVESVSDRWKANARYAYTAKAEKQYKYTFEAWTKSGERTVLVQYYENNEDSVYLNSTQTLTTTRQTFEIVGQPIPKEGIWPVQFQCADQTGTFYVKMLSIESITPEDQTAEERWSSWVSSECDTTLEYSVADDGINTITVGGTADSNRWKASAQYTYTAKAGKQYRYTFAAWTAEGERTVNVQYYGNSEDSKYLGSTQNLTTENHQFEIVGDIIPKDGIWSVEFQCADKTGIFYVKIVSIEPVTD
jgi:hypothetical protein